jgi:hypothetical protein
MLAIILFCVPYINFFAHGFVPRTGLDDLSVKDFFVGVDDALFFWGFVFEVGEFAAEIDRAAVAGHADLGVLLPAVDDPDLVLQVGAVDEQGAGEGHSVPSLIAAPTSLSHSVQRVSLIGYGRW